MTDTLNLLVTLDERYLPHLNVMLFSLLRANPGYRFDVYVLHTAIPEQAFGATEETLGERGRLLPLKVNDPRLDGAPTSGRYPREIYYRIFAAKYLPRDLERVLYLDPDLIVNGSVLPLYETDMREYYFAAASHIGEILRVFNSFRLDMDEGGPYVNSGVMLMNLELLRREQDIDEVFRFISLYKSRLMLPDQDIISGLYGSRIYALDAFRYNMTEKLFRRHSLTEKELTLDWVRRNAVIIHYCGRNKPWKPNYRGQLDVFYKETLAAARGNERVFSPQPVAL